ncbi:SDR family NAD(P)-dependent oxidoreductase, partial [Variovorax sp. YR752]|uniref:SDR family NAD(P)-dependent oxidoreductase n=1 Tax=Variovorax sp. YR752 TaxID=1884383 RepID=UPI003137DFCE
MSTDTPTPTLRELSPLKLALLAGQARAASEPLLRADPIAIIGMGCRLPGDVFDAEGFWQLLCDGIDAVREVPPGRWNTEALYDPDPAVPGKIASKWGGFLDTIDGFDAAFFGILPREAERMDPQQRLFLEVAIEALDHAGLPRDKLAGSRTGAFVASYYNEYAQLQYGNPAIIDARTLTGTVHSVLVNRLSYLLDLRGPSISIDTACSSSLVAIHLACQSLRHGESDIAIAGGVSLMVTEAQMISLSKVGFMAPDGRCKTFDASADGFGRGEGCSVLVMKRLADALADGDRVLAVVRGSAVNQDGHSTVLAAPNGLAQQALIREALDNAQVEASSIGFIETHGTGTPLGDPIEVEALGATVGVPAAGATPCLLGAAKANLGHLEAASGATGVIKAVQVLRHGEIPAQVHFRNLNPHISLAGTRLAIAAQRTPWPAGAAPRRIGTSGFGVGGTNAHVILEEAPRLGNEPAAPTPAPWLLPLSAQSEAALQALARRWVDFLGHAAAPLPALCAAAGERRSHYDHRLAAVGSSSNALITQLQDFAEGRETAGLAVGRRARARPLRLAFVFGGQGQQWLGMGRELLRSEPLFRDTLHDIDARLRRHVDWSLLEQLAAPEHASRLDDTEIAQPVLFALQVALTALWAHWGIRPQAVTGHSVGEIAALHVAGVLDLDEALRVVVLRARFMQRATGQGAMAAVGLTEAQAQARLAPHGGQLSVGAVNSPRGVVLSGERPALTALLAELEQEGVPQRMLPVNYAFHSAQMKLHAEAFAQALGEVRSSAPRLPVYSTVSGRRLDARVDAAYLAGNVRQPVRFADAVTAMLGDGHGAFLEIAAHPVLAGAIAECAETSENPPLSLASLRRGRAERESLLQSCAALYAAGHTPDWVGLQGGPAEVLDLPAYPWQHQRYWLPLPDAAAAPIAAGTPAAPLLGRRLDAAGGALFEAHWPGSTPAWLSEHRVGGRLIVPGMALLEALREAAAPSLGADRVRLDDVVIHRPLQLDEGAASRWQVLATEVADGRARATLHGQDTAAPTGWQKIASASVTTAPTAAVVADALAASTSDPPLGAVYDAFAGLGIQFGPSFRVVRRLDLHDGAATAWLALADADTTTSTNTLLLDGALQAALAALGGGVPREALLPLAVEVAELPATLPAALRAELRWTRPEGARTVRVDIVLHALDGRVLGRLDGVSLVPAGELANDADDVLYEIVWTDAEPASAGAADAGCTLVLGHDCDALAAALRAQGRTALARAIAHWPAERAGWEALLQAGEPPRPSAVVLLDDGAEGLTSTSLLGLVQALAQRGDAVLSLVTRGAQAVRDSVPQPAAAALWGLGSVITVEHPELALRLIDLDPDTGSVDVAAVAERLCTAPGGGSRWAVRGTAWLRPQLRHHAALPSRAAAQTLRADPRGTLDGLAWVRQDPFAPGPGEVRLRVLAAGLNFRDVLMALGMIPGQEEFLGAECAGVVEACGTGVSGLNPGDRVFGFAPRSLASHVNVPAAYLAPWPEALGSMEQAASLPVAFLTAMLGLEHIAGLRPGQRVLIHSAAGGVGLAALQLARRAGAEVFATAGSPAKRDLLHRLGATQVFDSRSPDFSARVLALTDGRGVDVVLNSLAGELIGASVEALAAHGCFLELGKRDLWSAERFAAVRPAARYAVYDLGSTAAAEPQRLRPMLDTLVAALLDGSLRPLPLRVYDFAQAPAAFRLMAQARHVGKLVLRAPRDAGSAGELAVRPDARYLITGGLGALGLHTARWLARRGARHLLLSARQAPSATALQALDALRHDGVTVEVCAADAGDEAAMRKLLAPHPGQAPLRGIVHAAGVLDDGPLLLQDAQRFARVRRGKADGARLLDTLTRGLALDFFVLYSAAGTLLGPAGQGPYAAANAELDAIAQARRSAGLPALSVAWGLWRDGGMGAQTIAAGHDTWTARGLRWLEADAAFAHLERLWRDGATHAAVLPLDWARFLAAPPAGL